MAALANIQGAVTYQIPSANTTWSTVFRQLENNKARLNITDYSVSQTTLEQVRNSKWTVLFQLWVELHYCNVVLVQLSGFCFG